MKIIVTDLTRFKKPEVVCLAGVRPDTHECVRPMKNGDRPYMTLEDCKRLNLLPGAILKGDLKKCAGLVKPHLEDHSYTTLEFLGPCSAEQFEAVLRKTTESSIYEGFGKKVPAGEKVVPYSDPPRKSIITIQLKPDQVQIVRDGYKPQELRLHLTDNDGRYYRFLSITDLGFHNVAIRRQAEPHYTDELNKFIIQQKKVYLRVGLSRQYTSPDGRVGFWTQVNGIYTFPDFLPEVRTHTE